MYTIFIDEVLFMVLKIWVGECLEGSAPLLSDLLVAYEHIRN